MTHKTENAKMNETQNSLDIGDARVVMTEITLLGTRKKTGSDWGRNIFQTQNLGKAPPGYSRSPGGPRGHPPEQGRARKKASLNAVLQSRDDYFSSVNQLVIQNKYSNFYKHLNFTIMKKQVFLLVALVLAAFANVTQSYGQCTPDPLHPAAGVAYDYEVTISGTTGGTTPTYVWNVTQDVNLLDASKYMTAGTDYTINSGSATSKINITWSSAAVANPKVYYLVVKYTETSTSGCTVENMKVWQIDPLNTFLLAVAGSNATGDITKATTCPPAVDGATVTAGATPSVAYTYGQSTIYYKVTASGAIGTWTPSISLPALTGAGTTGQNYNNAEWSSDNGTTWNTFGLTDGDADGGTFTSTVTTAPVTVAGSDIIVRVKIDNVNFESLAAQPIEMGVDGVLPGNVKDIVSTSNCADEADFGKKGTHTVEARPTVTDATTDTPNPTNFIPKNP